MKIADILKKYSTDKNHAIITAKLSVLIFNKLKNIFPTLQNYDNEENLFLLETGGLLHDIGIKFSNIYKLPHHKASMQFLLNNKPDEISEENLPTLALLTRYHRKSLPDENKHKVFGSLNQKDKKKVLYFGSIIRLSDALDASHLQIVEDFDFIYNKEHNVLTLLLSENIMLDKQIIKTLKEKKKFLETVFSVKLEFGSLNQDV